MTPLDSKALTEEIISRLDIFAEYEAMGVRLVGVPNSSNKCECYAVSRDERRPSCVIFGDSGKFHDSATGETLSFWEFAVKHGGTGLTDWKSARDHFARKVGLDDFETSGSKPRGKGKFGGVIPAPDQGDRFTGTATATLADRLPANSPQQSLSRKVSTAPQKPPRKKKQSIDPAEMLEFLDWTIPLNRLADLWCRYHKKGASVEAIKLCGGRIAHPLYFDKETKEKKRSKTQVIALPCYAGPDWLAAPPVAWVLWDVTGKPLPVYRGPNLPRDEVKMKSIGSTRGTMMGLHGLQVLTDPARRKGVELVVKSAGPSDMLAILAAQPADLRDRHIVITNASSETGDVLRAQTDLLAGIKTWISHDADEAGELGADKWLDALAAAEHPDAEQIILPFPITPSKGKDSRDFLVQSGGTA